MWDIVFDKNTTVYGFILKHFTEQLQVNVLLNWSTFRCILAESWINLGYYLTEL